jgi:hypothetical protein
VTVWMENINRMVKDGFSCRSLSYNIFDETHLIVVVRSVQHP